MLRKPATSFFTLSRPGAGFCNVLKYKADTFYLSTIQKPAPEGSFQFVIINVLVSSFRFIWIGLLWVWRPLGLYIS